MNTQNIPNITVIVFVGVLVLIGIGLWILTSIWGAVNARAEELVVLELYPNTTAAIGQAAIEVIVVPVATVALAVVVLIALGIAFWNGIRGAGGRL